MAPVAYKIPRITDEQLNLALTKLADQFGGFAVHMQIADAGIGAIHYPEANDPNFLAILVEKSELITHFSATIQSVLITYYRGGVQGQVWEKSPIYDDLSIDTQGFAPERVAIAAQILRLVRPIQLPRPSDPIALLEAQRALQESSFSRLQLQLEAVFAQTIDLRGQIDEQVRTKEQELEDSFKQKQSEASQLLKIQSDELARKHEELDERRKSIDESDNTFARRQIRERMLSDVAARVQDFGVSDATVAARKPVAMGMFALASFLTALLVFTAAEIVKSHEFNLYSEVSSVFSNADAFASPASAASNVPQKTVGAKESLPTGMESSLTERLILWLRFSLLSIGLAASILYYIRWQNQWATTFSSTEQSLQQFHIDVNRANWVVETCLEWRKETASDIPGPLIESLTRGLFSGRDVAPNVLHPADELASALMGSASKLSLDINGNRLDINKPSKIPNNIVSGAAAAQ